ncbi:MAG: type II secretion system minor pseudopilin GspK [Gammaproteobacteria bacterium]|jgi:general secretion pathway protein K
MNGPTGQRGVALLTALLIVAILTTVSVYLAWDQTLAIRRTQDLVAQGRAYALCLGAEAWAAQTLADNARKHPGVVDLKQSWASPMLPVSVGDAQVVGQLEDLQGRFNLNNLVAGQQVIGTSRMRLARLLEMFKATPGLVDAVIDWIDPNDIPTGSDGAEDGYYLGLQPPYRAANNAFIAASTLRVVRGFDAKLTNALAPYVVALPSGTAINVNTAPAPVLRSLGLSADRAQAIIKQRNNKPFTALAQFLASPTLSGQSFDSARLGVTSDYFLLHVQATIGRARATLYSVLQIEDNGTVRVLMRSRDTAP